MEEVNDNASAFIHGNRKTNSYWLKLTLTKLSHSFQNANVDNIIKTENEGTLFRD